MPRPVFEKWVAPSNDIGVPGGRCIAMLAGQQLNIGDCVDLSAAGLTVIKETVTANHLRRIGIVVGGTNFYDETSQDTLDIGESAADLNEKVFVAVEGVTYCVADATAILVGSYVAPSTTTAGRVRLATVTTDLVAGDSGKILGIALDANGGVAGTKIRVMLFRI